ANGDGVLDASDPVFGQLKVWQDLNDDGTNVTALPGGGLTQEAGELKSMADLGITQIDYGNNRCTQNGQLHYMSSGELDADTQGTRVNLVGNGIVIQQSDGTQRFIIRQVTGLVGGDDVIEGVFEDGDPTGGTRTTPQNPNAAPQELTIPVALLL